jgi:hypothetical protein
VVDVPVQKRNSEVGMRIVPVMGDLPAVAVAQLTDPPAPPTPDSEVAPPAVAPTSSAGGADAGASDGRRPPHSPLPPAFDPPLIAQRAVLGLPVGPLIADHALAEGISYGAASAAVDREMPEPEPEQ